MRRCVRLARPAQTRRLHVHSRLYHSRLHASTESPSELDFGNYQVILPEEPHVWGVSHIAPRNVPDEIVRPRYAIRTERSGDGSDIYTLDPYHGDGRITLGQDEESRLRTAALLAKKVREYAGTLVKVRVARHLTVRFRQQITAF
jgi:hypothetical protein